MPDKFVMSAEVAARVLKLRPVSGSHGPGCCPEHGAMIEALGSRIRELAVERAVAALAAEQARADDWEISARL